MQKETGSSSRPLLSLFFCHGSRCLLLFLWHKFHRPPFRAPGRRKEVASRDHKNALIHPLLSQTSISDTFLFFWLSSLAQGIPCLLLTAEKIFFPSLPAISRSCRFGPISLPRLYLHHFLSLLSRPPRRPRGPPPIASSEWTLFFWSNLRGSRERAIYPFPSPADRMRDASSRQVNTRKAPTSKRKKYKFDFSKERQSECRTWYFV